MENKQILLSVILNLETLSFARNQDEKQLAIDISNNQDFNSQTFILQKNISGLNNTKSTKSLDNIESFIYIYAPYPVNAVFTKSDGSSFILNLIDLTIIRAAFTSIVLTNTDLNNAITVKAIYS